VPASSIVPEKYDAHQNAQKYQKAANKEPILKLHPALTRS
jgi:hypothetical protein